MPNIIQVSHHGIRVTKAEAAEQLGIKTYDVALPEQWLDDVSSNLDEQDKKRGVTPPMSNWETLYSSVVWSYDGRSFMGYPHPLTLRAWALLRRHDQACGSHFVDEQYGAIDVLDIA